MADEKKRVLGPGAKGDPENPGATVDLSEATATEVVEAVEEGQVAKEEALAAERQRDQPRKTVTSKLQEGSQ